MEKRIGSKGIDTKHYLSLISSESHKSFKIILIPSLLCVLRIPEQKNRSGGIVAEQSLVSPSLADRVSLSFIPGTRLFQG